MSWLLLKPHPGGFADLLALIIISPSLTEASAQHADMAPTDRGRGRASGRLDPAIQRGSIDITLEIDTAINLVETTKRPIEAVAKTSSRARPTAQVHEKLLEEGKATTFDVVHLQHDYADARSRELAAVANHRKAIPRLSLKERGANLEDEAAKENPYVSPGLMQKSLP